LAIAAALVAFEIVVHSRGRPRRLDLFQFTWAAALVNQSAAARRARRAGGADGRVFDADSCHGCVSRDCECSSAGRDAHTADTAVAQVVVADAAAP
jgi:hypothetical protein